MTSIARVRPDTGTSCPALAAALARCGDERTRDLVEQLQAADATLAAHGAGVARLAVAMGQRLGIAGERLDTLCRAALLHDIGKRYVPREVLAKPGALLAHERQLVEAHAAVGASMLLQAGLLSEAAIVRHHHERWDGAGYPDRLHGDAIPLESRIILVADTFDAMTSDRAYRAAMPRALALCRDRARGRLAARPGRRRRGARRGRPRPDAALTFPCTCCGPCRWRGPARMRGCGRCTPRARGLAAAGAGRAAPARPPAAPRAPARAGPRAGAGARGASPAEACRAPRGEQGAAGSVRRRPARRPAPRPDEIRACGDGAASRSVARRCAGAALRRAGGRARSPRRGHGRRRRRRGRRHGTGALRGASPLGQAASVIPATAAVVAAPVASQRDRPGLRRPTRAGAASWSPRPRRRRTARAATRAAPGAGSRGSSSATRRRWSRSSSR